MNANKNSSWVLTKPLEEDLIGTAKPLLVEPVACPRPSHVVSAFHFHHHWSHAAEYEETARRTAELFGVRSGAGLYCKLRVHGCVGSRRDLELVEPGDVSPPLTAS